MRVLHFGKFTHHEVGGIERHVEGLTTGLAAAGLGVYDLVYDARREGGPREVGGVEILHVPCYGRPASLPFAPSAFSVAGRTVSERKIDLVHMHFPDPLAHAVASLLPRRVRCVATWHSDIVRQRLFGAAYRTAASLALRPLDAVIGATPLHIQSPQIPLDVPPGARYVVPYGVDIEALAATRTTIDAASALRARWGTAAVIFALGRHVYYKGFDVLIRAMQDVNALLVIGGDGPMTQALRALVHERQLDARVRFAGSIPEADLAAHFHACDVFCLPSTAPAEAFGLAQAEAMACAKPVVNCALGNGVNFVSPDKETGLTVPPGDEAALAGALNRLLSDKPLAARLGHAGRARVATMFSMDAMVKSTIAVYEAALRQRPLNH